MSNLTERDIIYVTFINKIYFNDKSAVSRLAKLAPLPVVVVVVYKIYIANNYRGEYRCHYFNHNATEQLLDLTAVTLKKATLGLGGGVSAKCCADWGARSGEERWRACWRPLSASVCCL